MKLIRGRVVKTAGPFCWVRDDNGKDHRIFLDDRTVRIGRAVEGMWVVVEKEGAFCCSIKVISV